MHNFVDRVTLRGVRLSVTYAKAALTLQTDEFFHCEQESSNPEDYCTVKMASSLGMFLLLH